MFSVMNTGMNRRPLWTCSVSPIISGVIIDPHGLHLLDKNSAIDLFSTIGLLYIMFIAGLEQCLA